MRSLVTVFGLQGVLMWVVSLSVQLGSTAPEPDLGALATVGSAVWLVGFGFESVGDFQLARFKADPASAGAVMDRGGTPATRTTSATSASGGACTSSRWKPTTHGRASSVPS